MHSGGLGLNQHSPADIYINAMNVASAGPTRLGKGGHAMMHCVYDLFETGDATVG